MGLLVTVGTCAGVTVWRRGIGARAERNRHFGFWAGDSFWVSGLIVFSFLLSFVPFLSCHF